jgi:two-component system invasion response regulator UvrY
VSARRPPLRVIVCDDSADLRDVVRSALERDGDLRVVGEAGDAASAIALAERERPDAIVLDLTMPGGDASALIPAVRSSAPDAGVVVFSGQGPETTRSLLDVHPDVVHVPKASPPALLVDAVRAAAS